MTVMNLYDTTQWYALKREWEWWQPDVPATPVGPVFFYIGDTRAAEVADLFLDGEHWGYVAVVYKVTDVEVRERMVFRNLERVRTMLDGVVFRSAKQL